MYRRSIAPIIFSVLLIFICGLWSVLQSSFSPFLTSPAPLLYTDAQAQVFAQRLGNVGFGGQQHQPGASADVVLHQVGIDKQRLRSLGQNVGNCVDITLYDLSPQYQLWIDNNMCFGLGIQIMKK